jgi:hypothetical protein
MKLNAYWLMMCFLLGRAYQLSELKIKRNANLSLTELLAETEGKECEEEECCDNKTPPHGGVLARVLEQRLHELLQKQ